MGDGKHIVCSYEREFGEMSESITNTEKYLESIDKKLTAQNGRIRKLENWRYLLTGMAVGVPFLANYVLKIVGQLK